MSFSPHRKARYAKDCFAKKTAFCTNEDAQDLAMMVFIRIKLLVDLCEDKGIPSRQNYKFELQFASLLI